MRIVHFDNHAGVPHMLAKYQKALGHEAIVVETFPNTINQPHDIDCYFSNNPIKNAKTILSLIKLANDSDVLHVHGGINWKRMDVVFSKLFLGKPLVVHYHGSDTRMGYGLYYPSIADYKLISRPDLFEWHKDAELLINPIDFECYSPGFDSSTRPKILHMSNDRAMKGTDTILQVIEELKANGADFDFVLLEKTPHEQAMKELETAHIFIDQFVDGKETGVPSVIGVATLEAMAMGKAVISTFEEKYSKYYPNNPVIKIPCERDHLKKALMEALSDMSRCKSIGMDGRRYVEEHHSPLKAAKRTLEIYKELVS
jgi:glycosyltransferase involved in cell wall biosynthesis